MSEVAAAIKPLVAGVEAATKQVEDLGKNQAKEFSKVNARIGELEQEFARLPAGGAPNSSRTAHNPVAMELVEAEGLGNIRAGQRSSGTITMSHGLRAALSNPDSGQAGDTAYPTPTQRAAGVKGIPAARFSILDLLPVVPVVEKTYEFVQLDGYINAADYQLKEGDSKAEAALPTELARAEVATIAHWMPASLQVINDNASLQSFVSQILSVGCRQKLEHEVLVGVGGAGKILGLVPQAQVFAVPGTGEAADRIGYAITNLKSAGWNATAVVMNDADWFTIASTRDNDGQYLLGSPRDPSPASLWSVPVVTSPSMPAGQALILDTSVTALLDRQQVTVEASRFDGDNFRRNLVTILAELRAGLALYAVAGTRLITLAGA